MTHRTNARSGGFRYSPTTSLTFSMKKGSDDNLKVSVRWGCNPKARQMRLTVLWLSPLRWAMDRVLQWVASRGAVSSVSVITRSTSSSVTARGRPLRGSSDSPSSLRSRNRERHFPTVSSDTPRSVPTVVLLRPSAQPKIRHPKLAAALVVRLPWSSSSGLLTRRIPHREYYYNELQLHHTRTKLSRCEAVIGH